MVHPLLKLTRKGSSLWTILSMFFTIRVHSVSYEVCKSIIGYRNAFTSIDNLPYLMAECVEEDLQLGKLGGIVHGRDEAVDDLQFPVSGTDLRSSDPRLSESQRSSKVLTLLHSPHVFPNASWLCSGILFDESISSWNIKDKRPQTNWIRYNRNQGRIRYLVCESACHQGQCDEKRTHLNLEHFDNVRGKIHGRKNSNGSKNAGESKRREIVMNVSQEKNRVMKRRKMRRNILK